MNKTTDTENTDQNGMQIGIPLNDSNQIDKILIKSINENVVDKLDRPTYDRMPYFINLIQCTIPGSKETYIFRMTFPKPCHLVKMNIPHCDDIIFPKAPTMLEIMQVPKSPNERYFLFSEKSLEYDNYCLMRRPIKEVDWEQLGQKIGVQKNVLYDAVWPKIEFYFQ